MGGTTSAPACSYTVGKRARTQASQPAAGTGAQLGAGIALLT